MAQEQVDGFLVFLKRIDENTQKIDERLQKVEQKLNNGLTTDVAYTKKAIELLQNKSVVTWKQVVTIVGSAAAVASAVAGVLLLTL